MSEALTIRPAEKADFAAIQRLEELEIQHHRQARPDYFKESREGYTRREFRDLLAQPCPIAWVAEWEGELAGLCFGQIGWTNENELCKSRKVAFIQDLATLPEFRGRGIGTALMERARKQAVAEGAQSLELCVWAFNQGAVALYQRLGMRTQYHRMELPLP